MEKPRQSVITGQIVKREKAMAATELRDNQTFSEKILWHHLRGNRLKGLHFRRQQIIDGFIADFYCHAAGVVVEVDGSIHHKQLDYDAERDQVIQARHLKVLRFSDTEVLEHLEAVLIKIWDACT